MRTSFTCCVHDVCAPRITKPTFPGLGRSRSVGLVDGTDKVITVISMPSALRSILWILNELIDFIEGVIVPMVG